MTDLYEFFCPLLLPIMYVVAPCRPVFHLLVENGACMYAIPTSNSTELLALNYG